MPHSILQRAFLLIAGLTGMAGVAMAAAASHGADPHLFASASAMCLAHAPVLLAIALGYDKLKTAPVAGSLLALGTLLFAGDLMMRQFTGYPLFPMSAPTGGMLMLAGWLAIGAGALFKPA